MLGLEATSELCPQVSKLLHLIPHRVCWAWINLVCTIHCRNGLYSLLSDALNWIKFYYMIRSLNITSYLTVIYFYGLVFIYHTIAQAWLRNYRNSRFNHSEMTLSFNCIRAAMLTNHTVFHVLQWNSSSLKWVYTAKHAHDGRFIFRKCHA